MAVEVELRALAQVLAAHVKPETVSELAEFLDAGEYGVGLEVLCDRLSDDEEPLPNAVVDEIQRLAAVLTLDRPSISDLDGLRSDRPA